MTMWTVYHQSGLIRLVVFTSENAVAVDWL